MRKIILLACMCAVALCFATPLAAEEDTPDNLVRADTDEGDFFIVSVEVPEVKTDLGERDVLDNPLRPETGAGDDAFILISPYTGPEADVPDNLVMPGTTDGDAFIVSLPEEGESESDSSEKTIGGIALLGCLGAGIVLARKGN